MRVYIYIYIYIYIIAYLDTLRLQVLAQLALAPRACEEDAVEAEACHAPLVDAS